MQYIVCLYINKHIDAHTQSKGDFKTSVEQARLPQCFLTQIQRIKLRAFPPRTVCIIHPQINKPGATALPKAPDSLPHIKVNIRARNTPASISAALLKWRRTFNLPVSICVMWKNNILTNTIMSSGKYLPHFYNSWLQKTLQLMANGFSCLFACIFYSTSRGSF